MNLMNLLGNLGNISKIQQEVKLITEEIGQHVYEGRAGAGMVVVAVSGAQQVISCQIDAKLIEDNDRELLEELVVAAVNDALLTAKRTTAQMMQQRLAEKLNIPNLPGFLEGLVPKA